MTKEFETAMLSCDGSEAERYGNIYLDLITGENPREYEDRRKLTPIEECQIDEPCNILAKVCSTPQLSKKGNKIIVSFRVKDATGQLMITFFGQAYMKNNFKLGENYLFYGKVKHKYGYHEMDSPEYQKVIDEANLGTVAKITPIYPSTAKLSQKVIRGLIETCLNEVLPSV